MARFARYLARAVGAIDDGVDSVRYRLAERFAREALVAFPYLSYGTDTRLYILGRVLEVRNIQPAEESASLWQNFRDAYRRFSSNEAPHAQVLVRHHGTDTAQRFVADAEGYFGGWLELAQPLPPEHAYLQPTEVELLAPLRERQRDTRFAGHAVVPDARARFGVISDIDDTVLKTGATSLLTMTRKTLLGNARTRLPFEGVDAFYQALHREGGADTNPIFYVSSSPWNLYDLLIEFLDVNEIPAGPLLLRDWSMNPLELLSMRHAEHKLQAIEQILATYPDLPFILIGDSGQEDPEIYAQVLRDFPGRILDIYIRDVTPNPERDRQIQELAAEAEGSGANLVLVPDTVTAARHALGRGWIAPEDIPEVARAKAEDEQEPE
jgi:phosphatidate phosphatase APP1